MATVMVCHYAAKRGQQKDRYLSGKADQSKQPFRTGEPVNQPALRDILHPSPDKGNEHPKKVKAIISIAEGTGGMMESAKLRFVCLHEIKVISLSPPRGKLLDQRLSLTQNESDDRRDSRGVARGQPAT